MGELFVLVIEDEPEVRAAVVRDLEPLTPAVRIDEADDVDDALAALADADGDGDELGLVIADHRLPGRTGVDLLVEVHDDPRWRDARAVLLTGQAGHADTIRAVNEAGLDHYLAKPWDPDELRRVAVAHLTDYVLETGLDPLPYVSTLDAPRLLEAYRRGGRPD
jgi:two-component system chemotaxis response regulator CheY